MADSRRSGPRLDRTLVLVAGLYLTGTGAATLRRGHWLFTDYLGLRVPALGALLVGILLLLVGSALWARMPWAR